MKIFCDGGSRGNPGQGACAFVAYDDNNKILHEEGKFLGVVTNNEAEYSAVILALSNLSDLRQINFFLDSLLVVNQLNGLWKIKEPRLRELLLKVRSLESILTNRYPLTAIRYTHIPREKNSAADALVNETLDSQLSAL